MPSWARRRSLSVLARSRSWDAASNWLASRAPVALGESICCRCRDKADLETRNCPATARTVPPASKAASIALTCSFAQIEHLVTAVAHHPGAAFFARTCRPGDSKPPDFSTRPRVAVRLPTRVFLCACRPLNIVGARRQM
jgi:hypothetical protein